MLTHMELNSQMYWGMLVKFFEQGKTGGDARSNIIAFLGTCL